jgi:hypothetical protein
MCEAVKHFRKDSICKNNCRVPAKENIKYKKLIDCESEFKDIRKFDENYWYAVCRHTLKKANCIVSEKTYLLPENYSYKEYENNFNQLNIFKNQKFKFIDIEDKIAIISGFPFFLIDYFGEKFYIEIIKNINDTSILNISADKC